jgi:hypothetical protein
MNTLRLAVFALFLVSCTSGVHDTGSLTPFNVTETPSQALAGQSTPADTLTPAPTTENTPLPAAIVEPAFVTKAELIDWYLSPDAEWLAYYLRDPGDTIQIVNLSTQQSCTVPIMMQQLGWPSDYVQWQADNRLLVIRDGIVTVHSPCAADQQDITARFHKPAWSVSAVSADQTRFLIALDGGAAIYDSASGEVLNLPISSGYYAAWSPDGNLVAVRSSNTASTVEYAAVLSIIDAATGQIVNQADESFLFYVFDDQTPIWLGNHHVLIRETRYTGPMLLATSGEVIAVRDLFGAPPLAPECATVPCRGQKRASGGSGQANGDYHIKMSGENFYHSDTGEIERIPFPILYFSPDGEWMIATNHDDGPYLRTVDPAGSTLIPLAQASIYAVWSPDSTLVAYASDNTIVTYRVPDGALIGQWYIPGYDNLWVIGWSLEAHRLIVSGVTSSLTYSLFLIDVPGT